VFHTRNHRTNCMKIDIWGSALEVVKWTYLSFLSVKYTSWPHVAWSRMETNISTFSEGAHHTENFFVTKCRSHLDVHFYRERISVRWKFNEIQDKLFLNILWIALQQYIAGQSAKYRNWVLASIFYFCFFLSVQELHNHVLRLLSVII
jgi:hypothetical protein